MLVRQMALWGEAPPPEIPKCHTAIFNHRYLETVNANKYVIGVIWCGRQLSQILNLWDSLQQSNVSL